MRSADALEKVSRKYPSYLQPFKERLIDEVSKIGQQEVRWHVAQMYSYLEINQDERDDIMQTLLSFLDTDTSNIVKVCSMQALADLAMKDKTIKSKITKKLKEELKKGSPAVVSRGKKLIGILEK